MRLPQCMPWSSSTELCVFKLFLSGIILLSPTDTAAFITYPLLACIPSHPSLHVLTPRLVFPDFSNKILALASLFLGPPSEKAIFFLDSFC